MSRRRRKRFGVQPVVALLGVLSFCAAFGAAFVAATAGPVAAHADLVSSEPSPCGSVGPTSGVVMTFSEEVDPDGSVFSVRDDGGAVVGTGVLDLDDLDRRTVVVDLTAALGPGVYDVAWTVSSAFDGDVESAGFRFAVDLAVPSDCALVTVEASEDRSEGAPIALLIGCGLLSIAALGGLVWRFRRGS